ncbi:HlyD family secretion protein [Colwellia sp. PAMC 21821]|uniref:HlyD family secretion protein n=1 Tax=Colwellia sp. PAMC 21821 TaxID=1816219 RepID=UPI0009BD04BB|nr:HlyD family secretion protein [Colwellia sp. PAMC 21821]ARD45818.1 multidrug transporter [Colwellia sp. PAMC 21821]
MVAAKPRKMIIGIICLLLILVLLYALSDAYTPSSSRGIVSANVVELSPRVSGEVTQIHVIDDAIVDAGTALFTIDVYPYELAVRQAEANLDMALQNVDASSASIVAAQSTVTQALVNRDNLRAESQRIQRLEERGLVAKAQADNARAGVADAEAKLATAKANLQGAKAALGPVGKDNPNVAVASAALARAQYDLLSTTVKAPHKGVVTNVKLSQGQFIGAGSPVLTYIDADAAWITVDLRENQLRFVDKGDEVDVLFDAVPGHIFKAKVASIAWGISVGRASKDGLIVNQAESRWFEPARRIPVKVELIDGMKSWPNTVRVGGKVHAVIYAKGSNNPLSWIAMLFQRVRSLGSYLY